ncbi:MAG: DNA-directed RNA polymerase subunit omega [Rubrobacter sp.]|jgi:DNA-directed RNA polymerase subunit omega|nr:DNA-directed RNA polymerase subunit omega [Rubrobacter sp.]
MLNELKIDQLLDKVDSRYGLVIAGARRARQINEYAATLGLNDSLGIPGPQVHTRSQHPLTIALEELRADKLEVGFKADPEAELAPERVPEEEMEPVAEEAAGRGEYAGDNPGYEAPEEVDEGDPNEELIDAVVEDDPDEGGQGAA